VVGTRGVDERLDMRGLDVDVDQRDEHRDLRR
jgi:hypothetical protein